MSVASYDNFIIGWKTLGTVNSAIRKFLSRQNHPPCHGSNNNVWAEDALYHWDGKKEWKDTKMVIIDMAKLLILR